MLCERNLKEKRKKHPPKLFHSSSILIFLQHCTYTLHSILDRVQCTYTVQVLWCLMRPNGKINIWSFTTWDLDYIWAQIERIRKIKLLGSRMRLNPFNPFSPKKIKVLRFLPKFYHVIIVFHRFQNRWHFCDISFLSGVMGKRLV